VVATGSVFVHLDVRGINHADVTSAAGSSDGQERVLFTLCGIPVVAMNLLIGDGVSGSLGVDIRNLPDGVPASTAKTVSIAGRNVVPIAVTFKTDRATGADGHFDVVVTPAKGSPTTMKIAYKLAVGSIDEVSPNIPMTPRFMQPGDTVTLVGQGGCAGSKVTVGNTDATVDGKPTANGLSATATSVLHLQRTFPCDRPPARGSTPHETDLVRPPDTRGMRLAQRCDRRR
jgi:hypothetical protein